MSTETKEDVVIRLDEELRSVKKSFEVLLLAIEAEGVVVAAEIAERLMGRLERLMRDIKTTYIETIFEKRVSALLEDHQKLTAMKASDRPSADGFIELVGRIERHISSAEREMHLLVPKKMPIVIWFGSNWKKMAVAATAVCIVLAAGTGFRSFATRGKGLSAEYYEGNNFKKLLRKHRDLKIDFELDGRGPIRGVKWDNFSARWTGVLNVPADGDYEFITRSDDGVRLWIDGELLFENWNIHRPAIDKANRTLTAGPHSIKVEWFQARGPAMLKLYWRMPSDAQPRIIEPDYFSPS